MQELEKYNEKIKELTKTWDGSWEGLENFLNKLFPRYTFKVKESFIEENFLEGKYSFELWANEYIFCSIFFIVLKVLKDFNKKETYIDKFVDYIIETMNKSYYSGESIWKTLQEGKFKGWK